ncbi:MAG TPA: glycosyltransferase [Xanthobacteraceae bacterium]|nr:glycosyltransferase [Xanthobacteraceae bacterium]
MKFVLFYQSFTSCWNHGNVHFLRGMARELVKAGHEVTVYEPADGWSRQNALQDGGEEILHEAKTLVSGVRVKTYSPDRFVLDAALDRADVVLVHEWNDPSLVAEIGRRRIGENFLLLFHDTHHRAVSAPDEISAYELENYDAVLAFGDVLREIYRRAGWGNRAVTWHESADTALFRPLPRRPKETDLVWIGNWGDGERDKELHEFLLDPAVKAGIGAKIYGVRYPDAARWELAARGFEFGGWLPNHRVPEAFARARMTAHVPRRPYVEMLPGIPTIRVFEALACGIPLVSAPWRDEESLFPGGAYLKVRNGEEAAAAFRLLAHDHDFAHALAESGLHAIRARHTCAHRVQQLFGILNQLKLSCSASGRTGEAERVAG